MGKSSNTTTPSPKRSRLENSPGTVSLCANIGDILESIDHKLSGLVARLSLVETLHREFQVLRESLESRIWEATLMSEDETSRETVDGSPGGITRVSAEIKNTEEPVVDVESRRIRKHLVISGKTQQTGGGPEQAVKDLTQKQVKVSEDTVKKTIHPVPNLDGKEKNLCRSRPILPEIKVNAVNSGQYKRTYAGMCVHNTNMRACMLCGSPHLSISFGLGYGKTSQNGPHTHHIFICLSLLVCPYTLP